MLTYDSVIQLHPVGFVSCAAQTPEEVPSEGLPSSLHINPSLIPALKGLEAGMEIYVVGWFDQADSDTLLASPGTPQEHGAFAVRSSCRPNQLGLTLTRIERIEGPIIDVQWLDFTDRTPILDIKRYNARWECIFSTPRANRTHFERQIERRALSLVLARPARNFHGEDCAWVSRLGEIGAVLVQEHGLFLADPLLSIHVIGNGHVIDAVQGMTGATFGNGRLTVDFHPESRDGLIVATLGNVSWQICVAPQTFVIRRGDAV
jgi:tRNA-Thr(GGU) m(6)t(6)A37 methyltransferase TsaA